MKILQVEDISKTFNRTGSFFSSKNLNKIPSVDNVSFFINKGETLALVGESGSGKTTTGNIILRFIEPDSGKVFFKGENLLDFTQKELKRIRRRMQAIFQDPYSSLDPMMNVKDIISEPLAVYKYSRSEINEKLDELITSTGLEGSFLSRYPHEFSGGQRQRIAIARALALEPELIICDEPVSSLDVSVQAQIINLLTELRDKKGISYLFIAHDLAVVKNISHRVVVMYRGRVMEESQTEDLFKDPLHPYTRLLLASIPSLYQVRSYQFNGKTFYNDLSEKQTDLNICRFYTRCNERIDICSYKEPQCVIINPFKKVFCHNIKNSNQ
jgi:oligopeptide/dipeptide ABC transporter ATP-binding protein